MSYASVNDHRSMVFDGVRNAAYTRALAQLVGPDTTVLDLGAGVGVHGLIAAKLGARAVHLVEPSPVLELARMAARDNGLANVHCHPCRIEELQLDAPVDVIVSVFTGNFLLTEDLLPLLFLARDRFLAPGGKLVPDRARMVVAPVSATDYYARHVDVWGDYPAHASRHGTPSLEFSAVRSFAANSLYYDTRDHFSAELLAAPAVLAELDFTSASRADCDARTVLALTRDGSCHGWLGWFDMRLGDDWLSTAGETGATHWRPVFLPLETPMEVRRGESIVFALMRPEFGEWTWTTEHNGRRQRQSTFLSQPLTPARLQKQSDGYRPTVNARGEAARWALAQMEGKRPVSDLAEQMRARFPAAFPGPTESLQFVKQLAERYS